MNAEPEVGKYHPDSAAGDTHISLNATAAVPRVLWSAAIVVVAVGLAALRFCDPLTLTFLPCPLHAATGIHCAGCGVTRATHALLHGRFLDAIRCNALWVVSIPLLLYMAVSEIWLSFGGPRPLPWCPARRSWFWVTATVALFFVLRNLPWYPMVLLAPPQ